MNPFSNWTADDVRKHNERIAKNKAGDLPQSSKPQPVVLYEPLAASERKKGDTGRILVRIESRRQRLLDPDNLAPKYFIDSLRYAGLIPDDRAQDIDLQVSQVKVKSKADECTVVEVEARPKENSK